MNGELSFEKIFKSLVEESRKIQIEYDYKVLYYKEVNYAEYQIKKINDVYPSLFKDKIVKLGKDGINKLREELNFIDYEDRIRYLEDTKEELLYLKNIVHTDEIVYEESEYGPGEEIQFKSFTSPTLIPSNPERQNGHKKSILKKASEYAIAWENAIDEIAKKVDFMIHQIELLPEPKTAIKDKNTIHLFYSWQSDNNDENKLIRTSIEKTVPHFKKCGKTIKVDSDMRGTTGSLDITSTLFQKINNCDIFIADINIVNKSLFRGNLYSPNANVLIELGYAASKLGWERVILLFNTNNFQIEQLPFDIRQKAIMWYKTPTQLEEKLKFAINELLKKENSG